MNNWYPKFTQAGQALSRIAAENGEEAIHAPEHAPDELKAHFREMARKMGLIPETQHVDGDGNPVYSVAQLDEHFGVSEAQAQRDLDVLSADGEPPDVGPAHRLQ